LFPEDFMSPNRRLQDRFRMLQKGSIVLNGGFSAVECVVLDVSPGGAKLKLAEWLVLPTRFELRLGTQTPRLVEVCHRTPDTVGVRFVTA
jgi:hypothetical protein